MKQTITNKSVFFFLLLSFCNISLAGESEQQATATQIQVPNVRVMADDNAEALTSLASKYEHAEGVPRNYLRAVELYCMAGKQGYADALYKLGWMYANGRGVNKDDSTAALLFSMAASLGHVYAQKMGQLVTVTSASKTPACLTPDEAPVLLDTEETESLKIEGEIPKLVYQLAPQYGIDPRLAMAIISVESSFVVTAKSPKNAQGLMQLIPETAKRFNVKNAYDPEQNLRGGLAYLRWLLAFFKGNVTLAAAAYNAGERAVEKYRGIPPYPETKNYVKKITQLYKKPLHPYKSEVTESSPIMSFLEKKNGITF